MENVLYQYALPDDPLRPLICFDERPCFLIGDVGAILPMSPGKVKRYHDEYEKHGSCWVSLAFEPHTGFRYVEVRARRTAVDNAQFMQPLIEKHYSHVAYIRLVQDNLNTHTPGSFFEVLPATEAFELSQRFELPYTPSRDHGSTWLKLSLPRYPSSVWTVVFQLLTGYLRKWWLGLAGAILSAKLSTGRFHKRTLAISCNDTIKMHKNFCEKPLSRRLQHYSVRWCCRSGLEHICA